MPLNNLMFLYVFVNSSSFPKLGHTPPASAQSAQSGPLTYMITPQLQMSHCWSYFPASTWPIARARRVSRHVKRRVGRRLEAM